jgi:hypothetical protein
VRRRSGAGAASGGDVPAHNGADVVVVVVESPAGFEMVP